jgi:taurine transport system permease protein
MIDNNRQRNRRSLAISFSTVATLISLWFVLTRHTVPELVFPSPESVWQSVSILRLRLLDDSMVTLARVLAGWALGVALGVATGLLMTLSRTFYSISDPIIEAIRPVPPIALIPFFIIWFGLGPGGQIALIALGCFMVMAVNTFVAVQNVPSIYIRAASSLGASRPEIYRTVLMPAILPSLISGFRIAAALAFGVGVAAEFMGAQSGLGFLIMVARRTLNTNTILLGTIIIGLESFLVDRGIRSVTRYLCRWNENPLEAIEQLGARI